MEGCGGVAEASEEKGGAVWWCQVRREGGNVGVGAVWWWQVRRDGRREEGGAAHWAWKRQEALKG